MFWSRSKPGPIGIDIGAHSVRALQFENTSSKPALLAAASVPLDGNLNAGVIGSKIKEVLDAGAFSGKAVVACLPSSALEVKTVRLPNMPSEELEAAAVYEARERFGNLTDDWVLRAMPAGHVGREDKSQQEVIILATLKESVEQRLKLLTDAGLTVVGLEPPAHALFRPFERLLSEAGDSDQAYAFLDLGHLGSRVIITRGRDIVFLKNCSIGGFTFDEVVADKLSVPLNEAARLRRSALATSTDAHGDEQCAAAMEVMQQTIDLLSRELSLCLRYYSVTFRGLRPDSVICSGSEAASATLLELLSKSASVPCLMGRAFQRFQCEKAFDSTEVDSGLCEWTMAAGLALRPRSCSHKKTKAA